MYSLLPIASVVTNNALAIRVVFSLSRVTPVSCNRPGLTAPLGKLKKAAYLDTPLNFHPPWTANSKRLQINRA